MARFGSPRDVAFRRKVAADLRASAAQADARATEYEERFADSPRWSASAASAPAARRQARSLRLQAAHVEAGSWEGYLLSIGRGVW